MKKDFGFADKLIEKYGIPAWVTPYVYEYIRKNPIDAIRYAASFIDVKRKRGEVTSNYVKLPNGVIFEMASVAHILSLFLYGEERTAQIYRRWSSEPAPEKREYAEMYSNMADAAEKHARAIRNLIQGIGRKPDKPSNQAIAVFEHIERIQDWKERIIYTNIIIRYSYANVFGVAFYKAFYFVMPEYMRNFGKAFEGTTGIAAKGEAEARTILREGIESERAIKLFREAVGDILDSVKGEMQIAKKAKIVNEVYLLSEIAIAYPLMIFKEEGVDIDVDAEVRKTIDEHMRKGSGGRSGGRRDAHTGPSGKNIRN